MERRMITHEDVMRQARQNPEFIKAERKIEPFNQIAKAIYLLRKKKGLSQIQLAKEANTHQTRISKIENAELNPRISTIIDIAEALGGEVNISIKECDDDVFIAFQNSYYFLHDQNNNEEDRGSQRYYLSDIEPRESYVTD